MTRPDPLPRDNGSRAIGRLAAIADLDAEALALLDTALTNPIMVPARRELLSEGRRIISPLLVLDGWAARMRLVPDGRRQLISFILPGEIVGNCGFEAPVATSTVVALTQVTVCQLPRSGSPHLERACAISRALDETYLMAQVVRLGRLNAAERLIDLLLELYERLASAGLASGGRFDLPLTQEVVADALGLTSVHLNRMVQQARKRGDLVWADRNMRLGDMDHLRRSVGHEICKVA